PPAPPAFSPSRSSSPPSSQPSSRARPPGPAHSSPRSATCPKAPASTASCCSASPRASPTASARTSGAQGPLAQRPLEDEEGACRNQPEADRVIPGELFAQHEHGEPHEHRKADHLLHGLELGRRIGAVAD